MRIKTYLKPFICIINCSSTLMNFVSGWNVDGEHGGNVEEGKDPEWRENN